MCIEIYTVKWEVLPKYDAMKISDYVTDTDRGKFHDWIKLPDERDVRNMTVFEQF